jgi:L-2-hydroxyglutarate oxidase
MKKTCDYLVIGAGVVGLAIARELKIRNTGAKIIVLEKEAATGMHSSGRNSGVLHSGIYYPPNSLKAKVCSQGAREMAEYCLANQLPLSKIGKVLIPTREEDLGQLNLLQERAIANGVTAERIDATTLKEIEPEANAVTGQALWIPSTSVGDSKKVMTRLTEEVKELGIVLNCGVTIKEVEKGNKNTVNLTNNDQVSYGHLVNASGLHADSVAHLFNIAKQYVLLPFKGIYWKLDPIAGFDIRHLIYPVPDLRVPFLGVHTTTSIDGTVYIGPTAVPAFGRENYFGMENVQLSEFSRIISTLAKQFLEGQDGFRRLVWQEGPRYFKPYFAQAAQSVLPRIRQEHLLPCDKVGIRAQMLDKTTGRLVTDFLIEKGTNSTHILNAISPAWTSAFPFARFVIDEYIES